MKLFLSYDSLLKSKTFRKLEKIKGLARVRCILRDSDPSASSPSKEETIKVSTPLGSSFIYFFLN